MGDSLLSIYYRTDNMTLIMVAARDIAPGEELTITYIGQLYTREERRRRLRRQWGFDCTCAQCSLAAAAAAAASEERVREIWRLERDLGTSNRTLVTAETGVDLVALYERERLDIYLGQALARAALNSALFGDTARAREYARRAADAVDTEPAEARSMRLLAENPEAHWTWELRRDNGQETRDKRRGSWWWLSWWWQYLIS